MIVLSGDVSRIICNAFSLLFLSMLFGFVYAQVSFSLLKGEAND